MSDFGKWWVWRDGDRYVAYDQKYPCYPDGGDPLTVGEPLLSAMEPDEVTKNLPAGSKVLWRVAAPRKEIA